MTRRPTLAAYLGIYVPILALALGVLYPFYYFALNSLNEKQRTECGSEMRCRIPSTDGYAF